MKKAYIIYYQDMIKNKTIALGTVHSELKDAQKAMRISMARARNRYCKLESINKEDMQLMDFSTSALVIGTKEIQHEIRPAIIYKYRIEDIMPY